MRFTNTVDSGILLWRGDPTCQAAHDELLQHLRSRNTPFLQPGQAASVRQQGNLGEHIAFRVGFATNFSGIHVRVANALNPLGDNSAAGLDILWLFLSSQSPLHDLLIIQETKTTSDKSDLEYAYKLTADFKKLFAGPTAFTLQTRIQGLVNGLEFEHRFTRSNLDRVTALGKATPALSTQVRLVPTLLHDRSAENPVPKLLAVRTSVAGFGWSAASIEPWSIALSDIGDRLERLAHGQS